VPVQKPLVGSLCEAASEVLLIIGSGRKFERVVNSRHRSGTLATSACTENRQKPESEQI
jgi:hypothetical protein